MILDFGVPASRLHPRVAGASPGASRPGTRWCRGHRLGDRVGWITRFGREPDTIADMDKRLILVVDDEAGLRRMVASYLASDGFDVVEAANSDVALRLFREKQPDLVLLDVVMPGSDGFEVLREIRAESDVPVIMLTARVEEVDRVVGLTVGADDYVTKPFSPRELTARIRAVLRRSKTPSFRENDAVHFVGLTIDPARREVLRDGEHVELSALEFDLLAALSSAPGRVFTREQLLERVWGWDYFGADRVVDVHISSLRRKLGDQAADPRFIATVRGVGYKYVAEAR
ncbi:transcriptional regulatory protein YycF [bacterium BMS3Bbin01]|nr:transcriptional regulatory protein YycF [bacterium BMS3Bbin01]